MSSSSRRVSQLAPREHTTRAIIGTLRSSAEERSASDDNPPPSLAPSRLIGTRRHHPRGSGPVQKHLACELSLSMRKEVESSCGESSPTGRSSFQEDIFHKRSRSTWTRDVHDGCVSHPDDVVDEGFPRTRDFHFKPRTASRRRSAGDRARGPTRRRWVELPPRGSGYSPARWARVGRAPCIPFRRQG